MSNSVLLQLFLIHVHEKQNRKIRRTSATKRFFYRGVNTLIPNKDWYEKGRKVFLEKHTGEISGRDLRLFPEKINSFKFEIT